MLGSQVRCWLGEGRVKVRWLCWPRYWWSPDMVRLTLCVAQVQYVQAPSFGYRPVKMTCPHCQASITTKTEEEASAMAWILCGACCLFGFWPCACIPFCVDSLQAVRDHS